MRSSLRRHRNHRQGKKAADGARNRARLRGRARLKRSRSLMRRGKRAAAEAELRQRKQPTLLSQLQPLTRVRPAGENISTARSRTLRLRPARKHRRMRLAQTAPSRRPLAAAKANMVATRLKIPLKPELPLHRVQV